MPPKKSKTPAQKKRKLVSDDDDAIPNNQNGTSPPLSRDSAPLQTTSTASQGDSCAAVVQNNTGGSPTGSTVAEAVQAAWTGPLVGYCFCKDWKITIKEPVSGVVVCHCKDCQAISSSFFCTFLTVKSRGLLMVEPSDRDSRNVESGTYYYTIKTGDNAGRSQSRTFCKRCGTVLFATPESLEGALPVNRNLFIGPHAEITPALMELLTPKIEIFTKDRSDWRPGQEGVLHSYVSMPMGFGGGGGDNAETNGTAPVSDIHL